MDKVKEEHTATYVTFCDGYDQTKVCLRKTFFRRFVVFLHTSCKFHFFVRRKQGYSTDILQIHLNGVVQADIGKGLFEEFSISLVLVHDLNARFAEGFIDQIHLRCVGVEFFHYVAKRVGGNTAFFAIVVDNTRDNFIELLFGYVHFLSSVYTETVACFPPFLFFMLFFI